MGFWTKGKTTPQQFQDSKVVDLPMNEEPDESNLPALPNLPRQSSQQNSEYPVIENDEDLERIEKETMKVDREIQQISKPQNKAELRFVDETDEEEVLLEKLKKIQEEKERKRLEEEQRLIEEQENQPANFGMSAEYSPTYLGEAECLRAILQQNYELNRKLDYVLVKLNEQKQ